MVVRFPIPSSVNSASASATWKPPSGVSPSTAAQRASWQRVRSQLRVLELIDPDAGPELAHLLDDLIRDATP